METNTIINVTFYSLFPLLFLLPTIISSKQNHQYKLPIILINIYGGFFAGVGWLVALIMCFVIPKHEEKGEEIKKIEGKIKSFKAITKTKVQFELIGLNKIIELTLSDSWVINRGDYVVVSGVNDLETGKFIGYAYKNKSKGILGQLGSQLVFGYMFVIVSVLFFWGIFPLFVHLPIGMNAIQLSKNIDEAVHIIG